MEKKINSLEIFWQVETKCYEKNIDLISLRNVFISFILMHLIDLVLNINI